MSDPLGKVTALITRKTETIPELLVFRHPSAGIQLPAGTVELHESFTDAVIREVSEETGLTQVTIRKFLGERTVHEGRSFILQSTKLLKRPCLQSETSEVAVVRGRSCQVQRTSEAFSFVMLGDQSTSAGTGWIFTSNLTNTVVRQFYHLTCEEETASNWTKRADLIHEFKCYWTPLNPRPKIHPAQQGWIDANYDELIEYYGVPI